MKQIIQFGTEAFSVPGRATERIPPCAAYDRVLLLLCSDRSLSEEVIAERAGVSTDLVRSAISYWADQGILTVSETAEPGKESSRTSSPLPGTHGLPEYTAEQVSEMIRTDDTLQNLLVLCQEELGKTFTEHETAQILALNNSYGMDAEYLLLLFALCKKRGKRSVGYAVRTAIGLYEEGVHTASELTEKIRMLDRLSDATSQIRVMFGIGERALTAKESGYITDWTENWHMPMDVIRIAFEITVDSIGKPKFPYVNKILSEWHRRGIRTAEEAGKTKENGKPADRSETGREKEKAGSFETEEFMSAALSRSFPADD
ncbi:MAG: DnaD domain protein [Clostridia bacterium]|nr:DnaD domain protein [Clostridia bacterium]